MARSHPGTQPTLVDEVTSVVRRARRRLRERRCRRTVRPRLLDDRRALVTVLEDLELLVDRQARGLSQSLMRDGYWEMWLTEAIEAALKPGMVALDIGANVGYFSMLMAKCVGPWGRVHAFEPNSDLAALLTESVARSGLAGRITIHSEPLWDKDGEQSVLVVPEGEPKNGHLVTCAGDDVIGRRLLTRRLDGFPDLLDADVIKIDVEGAEERIWSGMAGIFERCRPLIIFLEYSPIRYKAPMSFLTQMLQQGFALSELSVSYGIRTLTPEQVLAGNPCDDRMFMLVCSAHA